MTTYACVDCNIEFKVQHDADPLFYPVTHCPFCGQEIDQEETREDNPDEDPG